MQKSLSIGRTPSFALRPPRAARVPEAARTPARRSCGQLWWRTEGPSRVMQSRLRQARSTAKKLHSPHGRPLIKNECGPKSSPAAWICRRFAHSDLLRFIGLFLSALRHTASSQRHLNYLHLHGIHLLARLLSCIPQPLTDPYSIPRHCLWSMKS